MKKIAYAICWQGDISDLTNIRHEFAHDYDDISLYDDDTVRFCDLWKEIAKGYTDSFGYRRSNCVDLHSTNLPKYGWLECNNTTENWILEHNMPDSNVLFFLYDEDEDEFTEICLC